MCRLNICNVHNECLYQTDVDLGLWTSNIAKRIFHTFGCLRNFSAQNRLRSALCEGLIMQGIHQLNFSCHDSSTGSTEKREYYGSF